MDDQLTKDIERFETLMKNFKASIKTPTLSLPKPPSMPGASSATPKLPSPSPASKKNPVKIAEQMKNKKDLKPKIKIAANGQWSL